MRAEDIRLNRGSRPHLLVTGKPRTGKTTLVKSFVSRWPGRCGGFFTEEMTDERGRRLGFRLRTLDGRWGVLASINFSSHHHVGRYGVDIETLDSIGVEAIYEAIRTKEIVVIDEVGRMELFSIKFQEAVMAVLASPRRLLGVLHRGRLPFLEEIRRRPDVLILEVDGQNNQAVAQRIISLLENKT